MCSSEKRCAELAKGILDAAREDAVKYAHIIGTDATGTLVQASGECRRGHFFVSIVDEDYIFFDYTPRHTQEAVKNLFEGFSGYLQADASSVYDSLFAAEKGPTEVGCLAHARRKFHEAVREDKSTAMTALAFFEGIFRIEREAKGLAPSQRLELRKARIGPLWKELLAWAEKQDAERARDRSLIGRAVRYRRSHREALGRFLIDGRIKLTNNACENALRKVVVGRHNWVFVGSDEDAVSSCVWISLLASCRLHRVDPVAYLRDLFRILPMWPSRRLLELHPRFWSWTRARLDAAELDARYGAIRIPERVTLPRTSKLDEKPTA
jgi:hypothetical protein